MIVNFGKFRIFNESLEAILQLPDVGLSLDEPPLAELQTDILEVDMAEFSHQSQHGLEILHRAVVDMRSMEPQTLDTFFGVLYYIVADLLQNLIVRQVEPSDVDLQHLDVLAGRQHSSNVAEEVVQHTLLREMPVS